VQYFSVCLSTIDVLIKTTRGKHNNTMPDINPTLVPNPEQIAVMMKQLAELTARNAELEAQASKTFRLKVSDKGAVQINGIRRMPITLYAGELETILGKESEIKAFIAANPATLSRKEPTKATPAS
jgi:hypothetical protein